MKEEEKTDPVKMVRSMLGCCSNEQCRQDRVHTIDKNVYTCTVCAKKTTVHFLVQEHMQPDPDKQWR